MKYEYSLKNRDQTCTTNNHFCWVAVNLVARQEVETA